jgi:hypothetical protein
LEIQGQKAVITWHTAYAGDAAIDRYEIWRDGNLLEKIPFKPQTTKNPYRIEVKQKPDVAPTYVIKVVDKKARVAEVKI